MDAIVTITFHPCIDLNTSVPALVPDVKLKCSGPLVQPGGGGINIARAIKQLGGQATAIYMAGGENGRKLEEMLKEEGVPTIALDIPGNTRENIIVVDKATGLQYRFNMPGPPMTTSALQQLLALLEKLEEVRYLAISGSLAPGMSTEIFDQIAAIAGRKNIKLVVDTSGEALKKALDRGVYLVKASIHELIAVAQKGVEEQNIEDMARGLVATGRCAVVVVSMGAAGALLVTSDRVRQFLAPAVEVKSTVGAGDSMVAGMLLSLQAGKDLEEAVAFGCLCGAAATLHPGTSLCSREDVDAFTKGLPAR